MLIWNLFSYLIYGVFKVRINYTNGVTANCLLVRWTLVSYLVHFKARSFQSKNIIIVRENSGDLLSDLHRIQYRLLSLCETFCFAAVPTDRFTSTKLQQSLNSICSSQPTGHERISCHEMSSVVSEWVAAWWLYNSRTDNWAYCEVVQLINLSTAVHILSATRRQNSPSNSNLSPFLQLRPLTCYVV